MLAMVACSALLAVADPAPPPDVAQSYQEARAKAGRSAEDQVRLALWCEERGLTAERLNHLALAVLADPTNATARGLMGLVAYRGRFRRPEAVAEDSRANPALLEYEARRSKADYTAEAQLALGTWADDHGLKDQARAHFTAVTRLDPSREVAWKRLGCKKQGRRWITEAQLAAEKAEAEAQKQADKDWRPKLERYKAMLDRPGRREEAEAALAAISDPRAVPSIVGAFVDGRAVDQLRAVQLLGQVDAPSASVALATLAIVPRSAEVRRAAVETLRPRDARDFLQLWVGQVRDSIRYEVKPVGGPGSPGALFVEGKKANVRRLYTPAALPDVQIRPTMTLEVDVNGLPVLVEDTGTTTIDRTTRVNGQEIARAEEAQRRSEADFEALVMGLPATPANQALARSLGSALAQQGGAVRNVRGTTVAPANSGSTFNPIRKNQLRIPIGQMIVEAQQSAAVAREQLAQDVATLDRTNAATRKSNEPVLLALRQVTGKDLGEDGAAWARWWADFRGYAVLAGRTEANPTIIEDVPIAYTPQATPSIVAGPVVGYQVSHSCFAAGTPVRALGGDLAIESVRVGDLVLAQDPTTGGLAYRPVVAVHHNPPNATLRVRLGDDSVVATGIHRFWKAGKGWTMARDLKPGDSVRTLGGVARVESVEDEKVQPVFNLEVAEGHSFLVGRLGALVHDNSLVEPALAPFDAPTAARP